MRACRVSIIAGVKMPESQPHTMQCMEVWGGNTATDSGVVMPGLDAWVYSRPYRAPDDAEGIQGGDIHYVSSCATGRITRVLVADVSGHGREVAGLALELRNLMRRFVNYMDMTRFVRELNRRFTSTARAGKFATAVVATYWQPTRWLAICNAGHPSPLRFQSKSGRWEVVSPQGSGTDGRMENLPLGVLEEGAYRPHEFRLDQGDLILLFTDWLIEAQSPDGRRLGEEGLLRLLEDIPADAPESIIPRLLERLSDFRAGKPPDDDVTILLLRVNEVPLRRSLGNVLRMVAAIVRTTVSSVRRGAAFPWPQMNLANIGGAIFSPLNRRWRNPPPDDPLARR